jgi:hypothetical protein
MRTVLLPLGVNKMCTVLLPLGVNKMCTVLLPLGVNKIAVKNFIINSQNVTKEALKNSLLDFIPI